MQARKVIFARHRHGYSYYKLTPGTTTRTYWKKRRIYFARSWQQ